MYKIELLGIESDRIDIIKFITILVSYTFLNIQESKEVYDKLLSKQKVEIIFKDIKIETITNAVMWLAEMGVLIGGANFHEDDF